MLRLTTATILAGTLSACGGQGVVGKYDCRSTDANPDLAAVRTTLELMRDGMMRLDVADPSSGETEGGKGTYTVEGARLTLLLDGGKPQTTSVNEAGEMTLGEGRLKCSKRASG